MPELKSKKGSAMQRALKNRMGTANTTGVTLGYEAELWRMADALVGSMDAAEYKHIVLGLIFLKYISGAFEEHQKRLAQEPYADPEDPDEYRAANVFWVPPDRIVFCNLPSSTISRECEDGGIQN